MFQLLTFGGLSLTRSDGKRVSALGLSHRALLARLAVGGDRGVRRDELLALFWPDSDELRARGSLKQAIYTIRRELGATNAILGSDELMLNGAILCSDVAEFDKALDDGQLARACDLYRGRFLHAVHLGNGEFEQWRDAEARRLAARFHHATRTLALAAEAAKDGGAALQWWSALATDDPLSAEAVVGVMRAMARTGDRPGALNAGRGYVMRIRRELEVEPDESVRACIADLERRSPPQVHALPVEQPSFLETAPPPVAARGRKWRVASVLAAALVVAGLSLFFPERVRVVFAAKRNPVFASWSGVAAMPHTWAGYRAFDEGIRAWKFVGMQEPLALFDTAARLDSTSGSPLVWKALVLTKHGQKPASDSVLDQLQSSGRRQGAWDKAIVELLRAWNRDDLAAGHLAGHRLLDLLPESEWAVLPAYDAMALGHAHEAVQLFQHVPLDLAWTRWWKYIVLGQALHLIGDFESERQLAAAVLVDEPENVVAKQSLAKAYAGLGRVADAERICIESMQIPTGERVSAQPCGQVVGELWAHGHASAASRTADRFAAMLAVEPVSHEMKAINRAWIFQEAGRWNDVAAELTTVSRPVSRELELEYLGYLVLAQAARHDRSGIARTRARLRVLGVTEDPMISAGIAAMLGSTDEAVEWLTRALRDGSRHRTMLHRYSALASLHGYPPYEELLRVREDPQHRARYAATK